MSLEVGQYQQGRVPVKVTSNVVLFDLQAVRNFQDRFALLIQQIHGKTLTPSVHAHGFPMRGGAVAPSFIGSVAFHNCAVQGIDHGCPEIRTQKILVARLSRMNFDGNRTR